MSHRPPSGDPGVFHLDGRVPLLGLRWIQSISSGLDHYPIEQLAAAGIRLTSGRGANAPAVAEHAFALLLAITRRVGKSVRYSERGLWRQGMGYELAGKTLGVLGLGSVGEEIAWRAKAWGMNVIGSKRDPAHLPGMRFPGVRT